MDPALVCRSKVHYDTQWEAQLAANESEFVYGEEMVPYQCWPSGHWHITHKDRSLRRGLGHSYKKCPRCSAVVKRDKMVDHKCKGATDEG